MEPHFVYIAHTVVFDTAAFDTAVADTVADIDMDSDS